MLNKKTALYLFIPVSILLLIYIFWESTHHKTKEITKPDLGKNKPSSGKGLQKKEGLTKSQKESTKNDLSALAPEEEWKHLLKKKNAETLFYDNKNKSERCVEFVFLKRGKNGLDLREIRGFAFIPIEKDGSVDDDIVSGENGSGPDIFRLRFGLTDQKAMSGILKENQLYLMKIWPNKKNRKWYKTRFKTPKLNKIKKGKVKYYPLLVSKYKEKTELDEKSKRLYKTKNKKRDININLNSLPDFILKQQSRGVITYTKGDYQIAKKEVSDWSQTESTHFSLEITQRAESIDQLYGGNLTLYDMDVKKRGGFLCQTMRLLFLKNDVKNKNLSFQEDADYLWIPDQVHEASINLHKMINNIQIEREDIQKVFLRLQSENEVQNDEKPLVLYKSTSCFKDLSQVDFLLPKGRYILMIETDDYQEMVIDSNFKWPPNK